MYVPMAFMIVLIVVKMAENAARRKRLKDRIAELEAVIERQATELAYMVKMLQRARPRRPKMSATRSIWIAGRQNFKCAGDRATCPCWLLRDGSFDSSGWQIDHESRWSQAYDDRESNLTAKCATCHFRKTKEEMLDLEEESEDE